MTTPHMLTIPARSTVRSSPVEGNRILLSPIDPADGPELWTAVDNSRWHLERWLPWVPFNNSPEASQRYAEACAQDWDAGRAVRLAIRSKKDRELLGVVGLDSVVHLHRSCELGYWLKREACGKGLMTEAAKACVGFAFDTLAAHRIRCAAATENYGSLRVIMRLGFRFEGVARQAEYVGGRWVDHAVFGQLASDRVQEEAK
ncbi:MAG: GNAT family N-acetyltransferase [Polyangiaceae bacterium]